MARKPMMWCPDCDGCGWVEGGVALQTTCKRCRGKGKVPDTDYVPAEKSKPRNRKKGCR